jgi:hypothetical protein
LTTVYGEGWKDMPLIRSSLVVSLVLSVFCNPTVEEISIAGKPNQLLASPADRTPIQRCPKMSLKPSGRGEEIRVLWRVSGFVLGPEAVMDRAEAERMLAKPLSISGGRIAFDQQTCEGVKSERRKERLSDYLERVYRVTPKDLDVSDEWIEVIKTDCSLPGFQEYLRLGDRRLLIRVKGVFFFLEPSVSY